MQKINPFIDKRPIPKVNINVKIKVKTNSAKENSDWNKRRVYIRRRGSLTLESIKSLILEDDYKVLATIEDIFNNRLTSDVKSFILAILRIPIKELDNLTK